jgi:hypothetical protein
MLRGVTDASELGANLIIVMKNLYRIIFIVFCLLIIIPYSSTSQVLDLGIKAGVSSSFLDIMKNNKFTPMPSDMHWLEDFTGGVILNLEIGERWSFHSEILFVDKGARQISHSDSEGNVQGKKYGETQRVWTHNYFLQFPQTIRFAIPLNKKNLWSVYFELGGYFAFYLTSKRVLETTSLYSNDHWIEYYDEISRDGTGIVTIHRFDWGGNAGLGLLINLWKGKLDFNIKYDHDIQPFTRIQGVLGNETYNDKNYWEVFAITVGYTLPVMTKILKNY